MIASHKRNNYYPFGLTFNEYQNQGEQGNDFLYNGKELQTDLGLDWFDYGARMYDAALGRFHVEDAYFEKYYSITPYQYAGNNPLNTIDINGDSIWTVFANNSAKSLSILKKCSEMSLALILDTIQRQRCFIGKVM